MIDLKKEFLLGSSAIVLASLFCSTANSAEWEVTVSGWVAGHGAYVASDTPGVASDLDGAASDVDGEIQFIGETTLDNGLTIGIQVQLEAVNNDDWGNHIDESYVYLEGGWGRFVVGAHRSPGYRLAVAAPDVSFVRTNASSLSEIIPLSGSAGGDDRASDYFGGTLGSTLIENNAHNKDTLRGTYYSPTFAGFQTGVSFARDSSDPDKPAAPDATRASDYYDVALRFENSFGGLRVAASGRWGIGTHDSDDPNSQVWGFGINLGFAGVTIGGSFAEQNNSLWDGSDGQSYDAGVSYENGPWGFSITHFHGMNVDNEHLGFGPKEELNIAMLAGAYKVNDNLAVNLFGAYVDFDEERSDSGAPGGDDVDGFVVGASVKVSFGYEASGEYSDGISEWFSADF